MQKSKNIKSAEFEKGEIAMCHYFNIPNDYSAGLELFYCEIIKVGVEYSTCKLFYGETFNPKKVKGTFSDVCTNDLVKLEDKFMDDDERNAITNYKKTKTDK